MAAAKKSAIESAVDELAGQEAKLNAEIDHVVAEIRVNDRRPNADAEIAAGLWSIITERADRYREHLKLQLRRRDLRKLDILDVKPFDPSAGLITPGANYELITDGFYFLLEHNPAAVECILKMSPAGGIATEERERTATELEARKFELESRLEDLYEQMERAGFTPRRRDDLSARVFLKFVSPDSWSREKFEAQRQCLGGLRGVQSKLTERRREVAHDRAKLESIPRTKPDPALSARIDALKSEEKSIDGRLAAVAVEIKSAAKTFHGCIELLKSEGIVVDHRV